MEAEGDDELVGRTLGGRYRVERLLERGGMGAVYEAVQQPLGRRVALKVLHSHLASDEVTIERFRREAEATARLNHPHIVQVTDYRAEAGEPAFLVMEYLDGRSLAEAMREDGIFAPERAVHVAAQVLDALGAAHEAGIVHRDLKPTNVVLGSSAGLRDVVTILDFGIAKLAEAFAGGRRLTVEGTLVGTPAYMAPEQAAGEEVDGRADLYALGVLLYAMLAGRLPYASKDPGEVLRAIVNEARTPLLEVRPDLDADLAGVVERALEKDPEARWPSADAMRRALSRWMRRAGALPDGAGPSASAAPSGEARNEDKNERQPFVRPWVFVAGLIVAAGLGAALTWLVRPAPERIVVREAAPAERPEQGVAPPGEDAPTPVGEAADAGPPEAPAPAAPTAVEPPRHRPQPGRAGIEDDSPRLRVQGAAHRDLYATEDLAPRFEALSRELASCAEGQDIPEGAAPPVFYLDVTAEGRVRSVQPSLGEWPLGAANCITRGLTGIDLGPTRSGDGGRIVLTFGRGG